MQQRIAGGPTPTKAQQDKIKELLGCVDKRKAAFDKRTCLLRSLFWGYFGLTHAHLNLFP